MITWKELRGYEIRSSVDQLSEDTIDSTSVSGNAICRVPRQLTYKII